MDDVFKNMAGLSKIGKMWAEGIAPIATALSGIQKQFRPLASISLGAPSALEEIGRQIQRTSAALAEPLARLAQSFEPIGAMLAPLLEESERCQRVEAAGWLPHATTPFEKFADRSLSPDEVSTVIGPASIDSRFQHHIGVPANCGRN